MASYDYMNERCYVLDEGDYSITVNRNAHEIYGDNCEFVHKITSKIVFGTGNPRQSEIDAQKGETRNLSAEAKSALTVQAAVNRFDDLNAQFVPYTEATGGKTTIFTRENFAASFPPGRDFGRCMMHRL